MWVLVKEELLHTVAGQCVSRASDRAVEFPGASTTLATTGDVDVDVDATVVVVATYDPSICRCGRYELCMVFVAWCVVR